MTDRSTLRDKVVLITGGASGLGRATALSVAELGAEVVIADVDETGGRETASAVGGHFVAADVADLESNLAMVRFATETCGGLDHAFLNAGVATGTGLGDEFELDRYRRAMGINLDGVVFGVHAALPALRARGGGSILATSSLAGLTGVPLDPIYAANKHAVVGLVRSLGPALAPEGVRVNALCPGFAVSALTAPLAEAIKNMGLDLIPAETVAGAALTLLAGDMTGECWFVQLRREPQPFAFRNVPGPGAKEPAAAG
jgi:NAD(P)-dependent dehydrogenase (short-subunit alcohol dehydrogenase family)